MKHLYVHIPFCRSRCAYCDFFSEPVGPHIRADRVAPYLEALRTELADRGQFETIYLGGGTPTVVPADALVDLVADLAARLTRAPEPGGAGPRPRAPGTGAARPAPEFTIEANPGTMDALLLERLSTAGVTRLSLGVQSFSPSLRAALGRRVSQREIEDALAAVAAAGRLEWNLDLVFGIPGQTWESAAADLEAAVAAGPTHISLYDLTYSPAYAARVGADAREAAGLFAERHYADAVSRLQAAGYRRYEVSNFALPGHECRHNQAYWRGEDYLGIGASAVSTVSMDEPGAGGPACAERRVNLRSVAGYLAGDPPEIEVIMPRTRLWEKAMLGLRTSEGVDEEEVRPVVDGEARDRLLRQGCLQRHCGKLRLNPGFLDISNTVIGALLAPPED